MKNILVIQAHPDGSTRHYCHALAEAYANAALAAGHDVTMINLGETDVPILRSKAEWESTDQLPAFVTNAQKVVEEADHLVFIYPLWLGTMPALLKAWLEQVFRSGFVFNVVRGGKAWEARVGGQTARVVVTMGMPALFYNLFYFAHSLRSFERNILKFSGIKPVRTSLIGSVDAKDGKQREKWLETMARFGRAGI